MSDRLEEAEAAGAVCDFEAEAFVGDSERVLVTGVEPDSPTESESTVLTSEAMKEGTEECSELRPEAGFVVVASDSSTGAELAELGYWLCRDAGSEAI